MNELRHQEREERKALTRKLADAQATVEALQRERDTLREATQVICGHCCEPMAIPSKAILQSQLSQLQALVRALPDQLATIEKDLAPMNLGTMTSGDMKVFDKTKAVVMQTVMARLKRTLDATTPATPTHNGGA